MILNLNFHRHNVAINYHEGRATALANRANKHLVKREKHVEWMAEQEKYAKVHLDLLERDMQDFKDSIQRVQTAQKPKAERTKSKAQASPATA